MRIDPKCGWLYSFRARFIRDQEKTSVVGFDSRQRSSCPAHSKLGQPAAGRSVAPLLRQGAGAERVERVDNNIAD